VNSTVTRVQDPEPIQGSFPFDEIERDRLIVEHLPQVHYIARKIYKRLPPHVPMEDMIHAGVLGLMQAMQRYDPTKNVLLKYYAEYRIRGAILDSLRAVDWGPRTLRRKARGLERAILAGKARLGRELTDSEIAVDLGLTLASLQHLRTQLGGLKLHSLDEESVRLGHSDNAPQMAARSELDSPYYQTLKLEMTALLERAMGDLPEREREILRLYHYGEHTMKEVGALVGIGESRVSQLCTAALLRLRARLRELMEPNTLKLTLPTVIVIPNSKSISPRTPLKIPFLQESVSTLVK
jgi:RNA polymerase sigma factor FliA